MDDARRDRQGPDQAIPAHGRRLAVWCGLFADARAALVAARDGGDRAAGVALQILKSVYATFLGGMTRSADHNDKGTLRPDWHDQYVTQANVNALRALDKARAASGVTPIGLMKDAAWWVTAADAAPFKPAGMEITERDGQPGKWHVNRWARVDQDIVTAHASGRIGTLRRRSPRRTKPARRGASSGLPRSSARTRGHSDGRPREDIIRGAYDRHASRWLADEAGISPRTARRWLSGAAPRSRAGAIIAAARSITHPYGIAAARLRGLAAAGGRVSVGTVQVAYDDSDEGGRTIGDLEVDEWMADDLAAAADALDRGDLDAAAAAFSDAIVGGYSTGWRTHCPLPTTATASVSADTRMVDVMGIPFDSQVEEAHWRAASSQLVAVATVVDNRLVGGAVPPLRLAGGFVLATSAVAERCETS